jgi:uncharacterized Rmd1/YagE family protein
MSNKPTESSSSKKPNKPSAISKQVLKTNPIPQSVQSSSSAAQSNLTSKLAHASQLSTKGKPTQPLRSTKVSQKLVLFPQSTADDSMQSTLPVDNAAAITDDEDIIISTEEEEERRRRASAASFDATWQQQQSVAGVPLPIEWTFGSRTAAERMTKNERELALLPRAAAYCTGEGYDLTRLRPFLRQHHRVSPRLYDECLYAAYHFPLRTLRPGKENQYNIRVRSSRMPMRQDSSTKSNIDDDEEEMDYDEDHFNDNPETPLIVQPRPGQVFPNYYQNRKDNYEAEEEALRQQEQEDRLQEEFQKQQQHHHEHEQQQEQEQAQAEAGIFDNPFADKQDDVIPDDNKQEPSMQQEQESAAPIREPFKGGEVFIFDYGVVVFWNFRRAEELLMLEDFMPFSIDPFRDNPDEDMQIEEIHFQYDTSQMKPRIFNDMITLKSSNHMIKLTLSHGLSQSAVVARYEDIMDKTIEDTKHLPKEMAETGRLGKTRTEITKINGQLFTLRMNVNLVSNVLGKYFI